MSELEESALGKWIERGMPVELDLGCHRGRFIVAMAGTHPGRIFIGIERQAGRVAKCLRKIDRLGLTNATAVRGDCMEVLESLPDGSIDVIHVSFPDPWPKRRHQARRLVTGAFLAAAWRSLRRGGDLRLMTDDRDYFLAMRTAIEADGRWAAFDWTDDRVYSETEFERKFSESGKAVYRLALGR
jgi:tRNA (guanine-N7-)-methyltransferase